MSSVPLPLAPYPGLRAFRPEEAHIFCGRAEHRAEVLDLLGDARFLAVVGASGSGKSSLILAGLLPDIRDGQLIGVDAETVRIISLQPGLRPFANLADALSAELGATLPIETMLRRGPLGLVQTLDEVENQSNRALVIVVDQFEEIFRFAEMSSAQLAREEQRSAERPLIDGAQNEAQAFVNLLLQTCAQTRHVVFVLLTMRSEFLARCDQFTGLPEAISRSQFLTPRLNRQQLEQAIARPLEHYAASIQPELVNVILNQISPEQDQLPLMQHTLARMWERRRASETTGPITLTLEDYKAVGGLADALNNHGDALCEELARGPHHIAESKIEKFFRALAHHPAPNVPPVRRPISVAQLAAETGLSTAEVRTIADAFRAEGCHLLMPPVTKVRELADDSVLDISHESLLRQWQRLKRWLDTEWQQRRMAEELCVSMQDWERTAPPEKADPVRRFVRWKEAGEAVATRLYRDAAPALFSTSAPTTLPAWARRYGIDWPRLDAFCEQAFRWKKVTSILSKAGVGLVFLSLSLLLAVLEAVRQEMRAEKLSHQAGAALVQEKAARAEAEKSREQATSALAEARRSLQSADQSGQALVSSVEQKRAIELVESGTDLEALTAQARAALADTSARTPEITALVETLVKRGLVQLPETHPPRVSTTGLADAALSTPAVIALKLPPQPAPAPVVSFLKTADGLYVVAGAKGSPVTGCWKASGEAVGSPWSFETIRFVPVPDAAGVVVVAGDGQLRFISGPGHAASTAVNGETIVFGRVIQPSDSRFVLFGTASGRIGLWDPAASSKPRLFNTGLAGVVNGLDYSQTRNAVLASGDENWVKFWLLPRVSKGEFPVSNLPSEAEFFDAGPAVRDVTFSPKGTLMLLPSGVAEAQLRSVAAGAPLVATLRHQERVWFAKFSPDGSMIATSDISGRVYLWDVQAALSARKTSRTDRFFAPAIDPAESQWIRVMDLGPRGFGPDPAILSGHRSRLTALEWAPDGDFLVTAGEDGLAIVWQDPRLRLSGKFKDVPYLLPSHPGGVTGAAISPEGRLIATTGADRVARIYPLRPVMRGKFREWGGPKTTGIKGGGDLALLSEGDASSEKYRQYFLSEQPAKTKGLVFRLNPESFYINARWDYAFTPRTLLRTTKVRVRLLDETGQPTGDFVEAQPVDWGPPADSSYDFDLSPGLIRKLGLHPGQSVELEIPLLSPAAPPPARAAAL